MGDQPLGTGNNIAVLRKAAGLTQGQLANRAAISKSMLSKVEVGDRTASHALIAAVARALRVPVQRIHGQPYRDEPTVPVRIDALRDALRAWDLPTDDTTPRPLADLAADVRAAQTDRRDGHYVRLAANLPALLEELAAAAHAATDENTRRALFALLTTGYYCAHGLASRLGYGDLADAIDPKLAWAATRAHDPLAVALADWTRSASFQGRRRLRPRPATPGPGTNNPRRRPRRPGPPRDGHRPRQPASARRHPGLARQGRRRDDPATRRRPAPRRRLHHRTAPLPTHVRARELPYPPRRGRGRTRSPRGRRAHRRRVRATPRDRPHPGRPSLDRPRPRPHRHRERPGRARHPLPGPQDGSGTDPLPPHGPRDRPRPHQPAPQVQPRPDPPRHLARTHPLNRTAVGATPRPGASGRVGHLRGDRGRRRLCSSFSAVTRADVSSPSRT